MTANPNQMSCGACAGTGKARIGGMPCPHCLGERTLTHERAVELCDHEYRRNRALNKRNAEQHGEIMRLREMIESANDGDMGAWARQKVLMESNSRQRKTIRHMARRIAELGGGNYPVEHYDDEVPANAG